MINIIGLIALSTIWALITLAIACRILQYYHVGADPIKALYKVPQGKIKQVAQFSQEIDMMQAAKQEMDRLLMQNREIS